MYNKKNISLIIFTILLTSILYTTQNSNTTSANPMSAIEEASGGLFPDNGTNMQMIEANVLLDIDETYGSKGEFHISFDGNYTIYNQNNTDEVTIAAPFFSLFEGLDETLKIEVENVKLEFDIEYYWDGNLSESIWSHYFSLSGYGRYFAICNITFEGYSNTTIRYSFESIARINIYDYIDILYDVGSARAWNDVTTETVEFRVHGHQPSFYSNNSYQNNAKLTISEISDGMSYIWSWENTIIENYWVSIGYSKDDFATVPGFTILTSIIALMIIIGIIKHKFKRGSLVKK